MLTQNDLREIQKVVQGETKPLTKDIKTMQKDIVQIRKDTKALVGFLDREYLELRKRIDRIEEYLHLQPNL